MAVAVAAACGGPPKTTPAPVPASIVIPPPDPSRLDQVYLLESGGPAIDDTTVTVPKRQRRVIVLRRGAPDNSLFAMVALPDSTAADSTARSDSLTIGIRPRPGLYGFDLEVTGGSVEGATITMSYALHFVAPAGASQRYGGPLLFERALFVARVEADGRVVFLPTSRPGSDLVAAVIPGPGRYVVAAPR